MCIRLQRRKNAILTPMAVHAQNEYMFSVDVSQGNQLDGEGRCSMNKGYE
jgi:hypothetical protein